MKNTAIHHNQYGGASFLSVILLGMLGSVLLISNIEKTHSVQNNAIVLRESALSTITARNTQESLLALLATANNRQNLATKLTPAECQANKEPTANDPIMLNGALAIPSGVSIYANIHQVNCGLPTNNDFRMRYKIIARVNCASSNQQDCATSAISGWYLNDQGVKAYDLKLCTGTSGLPAIDNAATLSQTNWTSELTVGGSMFGSPSGTSNPYKMQTDWSENKQYQPTMPSLDIYTPLKVGGQIGNPSNRLGTDFIISTTGAQFDGINNTINLNSIIPKSNPAASTSSFWQSIWSNGVNTSNMVDSKLANIARNKDSFLKNYIGMTNAQAIDYTNKTINLPTNASKNIPGQSKIKSLVDLSIAQANYSPGETGAVSLMHITPSAPKQIDIQTGKAYHLALGVGQNQQNLNQWNTMKALDQHWIIDRWNDNSKCKQAGATSCANPFDQNQGTSDNTVVIIDGNVKLKDIQYPSAAAIIVLGDVIVEGEVILHSNLIVQGNIHLRGNLILTPRYWFGKIKGSPTCTTALTGAKIPPSIIPAASPNTSGSLATPNSSSSGGANGAKSS